MSATLTGIEPFLEEHDVLAIARISSRTLARWTKRGLFPAPRFVAGTSRRRWLRDEVEAWAASARVRAGTVAVAGDQPENS